jgi:hypothetical protein
MFRRRQASRSGGSSFRRFVMTTSFRVPSVALGAAALSLAAAAVPATAQAAVHHTSRAAVHHTVSHHYATRHVVHRGYAYQPGAAVAAGIVSGLAAGALDCGYGYPSVYCPSYGYYGPGYAYDYGDPGYGYGYGGPVIGFGYGGYGGYGGRNWHGGGAHFGAGHFGGNHFGGTGGAHFAGGGHVGGAHFHR